MTLITFKKEIKMNPNPIKELERLKEIAKTLRGETGCPWDKEQTHQTLKSCLIEEAYELYDAIELESTVDVLEELGDVLFQIFAHAQILEEEGVYNIGDVAKGISDKLIRRHPHVFKNESADVLNSSTEVLEKWEQIKQGEKDGKSALAGVPRTLPALLRAHRVQEKAARLGFDWDNIKDVEEKLFEEINELKKAISEENKDEIYNEVGDVLLSIVNLLRFAGINAEEALQSSTNKFIRRFSYIEKKVWATGKNMKEFNLQELDVFWNEAKLEENK